MKGIVARRLGWAVLVLATSYISIAAVAAFNQRDSIYHPHMTRGAPPSGFQEIAVRTSAGEIAGWYRPAAPGWPTVLFFNGNAGALDRAPNFTAPLAQVGYGLLLASYPGYDGNPGRPSEDGIYAAARGFAAWLESQSVADLIVLGYSLGCGAATQIALERRVRALILLAPFTSLASIGQLHMPHLPVSLLLQDRFDNAAKIARVQAPVMIVHGDADGVVPIAEGRRLFVLASEPKMFVTLPDAHHGFALDRVAPQIISFTGTSQTN